MIFWDSSALVHLLIEQGRQTRVMAELRRDPIMAVWWGSNVECAAALARLEREGALPPDKTQSALSLLRSYRERWVEILPEEEVLSTAMRLPRLHDLRSSDALQLAAALAICRHRPEELPFFSFDARLKLAAQKEGFELAGRG